MICRLSVKRITTSLSIFFLACVCNIAQAQTAVLTSCNDIYALCAATDCTKQADGTALCNCPVQKGENLGMTSCSDRTSIAKQGKVYSTYSASISPGAKIFSPAQICKSTSDYQYANCLDVECTVGADKKFASCTCPITTTTDAGSFMMQTQNCAAGAKLCSIAASPTSNVVLNGAPVIVGMKFAATSLNAQGYKLSPSDFCIANNKR